MNNKNKNYLLKKMKNSPSCEGNTTAEATEEPERQIHPLLRGEHYGRPDGVCAGEDSSPLARGTPP